MAISELKNKLSQLAGQKLSKFPRPKFPQLDKHQLRLFGATALLCAFVGFGGTYLYSRINSPDTAPGNYTAQVSSPSFEETRNTFPPESEETTQKEESVKEVEVEKVEKNTGIDETTDTMDPETQQLLDRLFQIAAGHKSPGEAEEPSITVKTENIQRSSVLDQIDVEPAIIRDTGNDTQQSKLLVKVTNNSPKPFEGYICFQLKDSSGNPAGIEILKVERIEPGKSVELVSWVDGHASELSYNMVGRFPGKS